MKAIIASLLIIAATPFAFADDGLIFHPNGRHYVNVPRTCGLTAVALAVTGDDVFIEDVDVLFGNGRTQDIPTREYFRENSSTRTWKNLNGGQRCIEGFWVKGTPTRDWNNARVHLYGYGPGEGVIHLGSALIRDFNF